MKKIILKKIQPYRFREILIQQNLLKVWNEQQKYKIIDKIAVIRSELTAKYFHADYKRHPERKLLVVYISPKFVAISLI